MSPIFDIEYITATTSPSYVPARTHIMAAVITKKRPGMTDPTGTGMMVVDCLGPFSAEITDPFLLLHAFGPAQIRDMPPLQMHPHRGFNEVPYLKQGRWIATDPWNMSGEVGTFRHVRARACVSPPEPCENRKDVT